MNQRERRTVQTSFEQSFGREILTSERRRVGILMAIMGFVLMINVFASLFIADYLDELNVPLLGQLPIIVVIGGIVLYELLTSASFARQIAAGRQPSEAHRYLNAAIETSAVTLILLVLISYIGPVNTLLLPPSYMYVFFIVLASLRLNFKLCVFTGAVAALEHNMLVLLYWGELQQGQLLASSPLIQLGKGLVFLLAGILAGFISGQIKAHFVDYLRSAEERSRVVGLFGQHVSPEVVQRLLDQSAGAHSEIRPVCIMFVDIRDFTTFSEQRNPAEVVAYLNTLFGVLVEVVNAHHGIVNKFLGDGFMAIFGAPLVDGQSAQHAVAAAREMLSQVAALNTAGSIPETRLGIGLHAGPALTGSVGSQQRKEYTVIGDVVNVAARIEQLNKQFGSQLLISEAVWQASGAAAGGGQALDAIAVKGRREPVHIFRLH